ncbi:hypothetical protein AB0K60_33860 [Thermopolyspora sp. NPDC052614]|uniref:hypothetical protein n=1 Tax=Thermopolyspora sp. NPDC052614 TaxID=3155682 RepID=UPI003433E61A
MCSYIHLSGRGLFEETRAELSRTAQPSQGGIMKNAVKVGLAAAVGYCLGRHRKLGVPGALAAAGVAGLRRKSKVVDKGVKALGSPELEKLAGRLREDLLDAGKTAMVAAASRQINAWSDAIHQRAETLRHPEEQVKATADTAAKAGGDAAAKVGGEAAKAASGAGEAAESVGGQAGDVAGKTAETAGETVGKTAGETVGKAGDLAGGVGKVLGGATGADAEKADTTEKTEKKENAAPTGKTEAEPQERKGDEAGERTSAEAPEKGGAEGERREEEGKGSAEAGLRVLG